MVSNQWQFSHVLNRTKEKYRSLFQQTIQTNSFQMQFSSLFLGRFIGKRGDEVNGTILLWKMVALNDNFIW